mmetsp:Transcript_63293/g.137702  ORF Transcript_63293/g.137702 Transcript_63293/m.137702 type:complete len:566 (+) Transcript_63293:52-1749(+)
MWEAMESPRAAFRAANTRSSLLQTAMSLTNTIVPNTLMSLELWLFLGVNIFVTTLFYMEIIPNPDSEERYFQWDKIDLLSKMTVFSEVYYAGFCYTRYLELSSCFRALLGRLVRVSLAMRALVHDMDKPFVRLSMRYYLAAILLHALHMNTGHANFQVHRWGTEMLPRLIWPEEMLFLQRLDTATRPMVVLSWSANVVVTSYKNDPFQSNTMLGLVHLIQRSYIFMQQTEDMVTLQLPFPYFHLMNCLVCVTLLVLAYVVACGHSLFAPVVYFFIALTYLGLMELASQLSDPFGDDDVDFPLHRWLEAQFKSVVHLVENGISGEVELPRGTKGDLRDVFADGMIEPVNQTSPALSQATAQFGGNRKLAMDTGDEENRRATSSGARMPMRPVPQSQEAMTHSGDFAWRRAMAQPSSGGLELGVGRPRRGSMATTVADDDSVDLDDPAHATASHWQARPALGGAGSADSRAYQTSAGGHVTQARTGQPRHRAYTVMRAKRLRATYHRDSKLCGPGRTVPVGTLVYSLDERYDQDGVLRVLIEHRGYKGWLSVREKDGLQVLRQLGQR